ICQYTKFCLFSCGYSLARLFRSFGLGSNPIQCLDFGVNSDAGIVAAHPNGPVTRYRDNGFIRCARLKKLCDDLVTQVSGCDLDASSLADGAERAADKERTGGAVYVIFALLDAEGEQVMVGLAGSKLVSPRHEPLYLLQGYGIERHNSRPEIVLCAFVRYVDFRRIVV